MDEYLKNLTEEQYFAATNIEGPMMVIAGPGTGKTQVLSSRIAYILKNTDVSSQNILVLTFTDSGVNAVRKRLQTIIGSEAYYVSIYTFHSFAENIISLYKEYFSDLGEENLSEIDQISLIREILDNTKLQKLKIIDNPYFYLRDIIKTISSLKRENISPKTLKEITENEITELANNPINFNKRTQKLKTAISARILSLEKSLELSEVYQKYIEELKKRKLHDFDDMIIRVLKEVQSNQNLKSDLQEKYLYILVDEYQDTNGAQNLIVSEIASYFDEPNLFVVGDDDQSIYKFQGASLSNIMYFHKKYPTAQIVVMKRSHRSTQKILDVSMSVVKNNEERLINKISNIDKNLFSSIEDSASKIVIADFEDMRYEYTWIINKLKELKSLGYKYSDIAIFFRNNYEINEFAKLLLSHDIPITSDKSSNILEDEDIRNLITFIRCIIEPYNDTLFFASLTNFSNIKSLDLIKLTELKAQLKKPFIYICSDQDLLQKHEIGITENKDIENVKDFNLFTSSIEKTSKNTVKDFVDEIVELNNKINTEKFLIFFTDLLKRTTYLEKLFNSVDKISKINKISSFVDEIKRKTDKNSFYSYKDFLNYIDILYEYNIPIAERALDMSSDSVRLMTAHKSKGLEFPIVIIPKCIDKYWGNNTARQNISLPDNLVQYEKPSKDEKNEEERRLFYVALTRAKSQIYITHSSVYKTEYGTKNTMPSMFIGEINKNFYESIKPEVTVTYEDIEKEIIQPTQVINDVEEKIIRHKLENFKLTATSLNNYLQCGKRFYYKELLRLPELRSDKQAYGTAIHKALEVFYNRCNESQQLESKDILLNKFSECINNEFLDEETKEKLHKKGLKSLNEYYDKIITSDFQLQNVIATEVDYKKRNILLYDIPLGGKIDAIVVSKDNSDSHEVRLIDYKTGKPKSRKQIETFEKNSNNELIPSSYYSQLMFYKILLDEDKNSKWKVKYGILDFIENQNGNFKREVFEYKDDEVNAFKTIIKETIVKIRNLEFEKIKKGKACNTCSFFYICWGG